MWDSRKINILKSWRDVFSAPALVEDLSTKAKWLITSVYGPNDSQREKQFWKELDEVRGRWDGAWCIGGDWNIVRFPSERRGTSRMTGEMSSFSDWINSQYLADLPMKGNSFTWSNNQNTPKASRLDRFLVSYD